MATYQAMITLLGELQERSRILADSEGRPDELFQPGQLITAAEYDEVLTGLLERLLNHAHTGDDEGSVLTGDALATASIVERHLSDGAVINRHLGDDAVDGRTILDESIGDDELASGAVGSRVLRDASVTLPKLADEVRALLGQGGEGGPSTEAYCRYLLPQRALVDADSSGAPSASWPLDPNDAEGRSSKQPPWWDVILAGRAFAAWEYYVGRLDRLIDDRGELDEVMIALWDWFAADDGSKFVDDLITVIKSQGLTPPLVRHLAGSLAALGSSGGQLSGPQAKAIEKALDDNDDSLDRSSDALLRGLTADLDASISSEERARSDALKRDLADIGYGPQLAGAKEGRKPRLIDPRGDSPVEDITDAPSDTGTVLNHFPQLVASLAQEPWEVSDAEHELLKQLPKTRSIDPKTVNTNMRQVLAVRYQTEHEPNRLPSVIRTKVSKALTANRVIFTKTPLREALGIELLRWAGVDEAQVVMFETALAAGIAFALPEAQALLSSRGGVDLTDEIKRLGREFDRQRIPLLPQLGVTDTDDSNDKRDPPVASAEELAKLEDFIRRSLAREHQAAASNFTDTPIYARKRHAWFTEGGDLDAAGPLDEERPRHSRFALNPPKANDLDVKGNFTGDDNGGLRLSRKFFAAPGNGAVWTRQAYPLADCATRFRFRVGDHGGLGTSGLCFALRLPGDSPSISGNYAIREVSPSFAVCFDIEHNRLRILIDGKNEVAVAELGAFHLDREQEFLAVVEIAGGRVIVDLDDQSGAHVRHEFAAAVPTVLRKQPVVAGFGGSDATLTLLDWELATAPAAQPPCPIPAHPGVDGNAVFTPDGKAQEFTVNGPTDADTAATLAAVMTHFGAPLSPLAATEFLQRKGLTERLVRFLNNLAQVPAGWVTSGDRNVRAVTRRRDHAGRWFARVHFALPYRHCGYRVQLTADRTARAPALVRQRRRGFVDVQFGTGLRADTAHAFSISIHGELSK
jgi:hypothetical protein